ncbi:MAG: type I DNA topoisomerase [Firmicutes bacterium]|nr:type I DNA topoisomerase [Bacillota bacterium]
MKLVIIEGIGKKDTIKKYLGPGYEVMATGGHLRDLQKRVLSVDVENNYTPKYKVMKDKEEQAKKLKDKAAKASEVLIATDPDREGEAIGWHLAHILGIKPQNATRIVFNEITKKAIQNALLEPRAIDMDLVNAQQARRILDRLVGYKLSPVVCKKVKKTKLSAGRVQSVTLKLVCIREREIVNFKPEEYWDFFSHLEKDSIGFRASLRTGLDGKKLQLVNKEDVDVVVKAIDGATYKVIAVKKSVTRSNAPAPYTTSSLQQDALNKAGMSLARTGRAAQQLYEGVNIGEDGKTALVTYIRTDSVRVSPDAQAQAKEWILANFGKEYAPEKFNFYKSKKSAQDAHEAIRPTNIELTPERVSKFLEADQAKLYRLIYNRFLASQMTEATYNSTSVDIDANGYGFRVSGRTPIFDGWRVLYVKDEDEADEEQSRLPELVEGDTPKFIKLEYTQKFTKPPARYTEATLVKAMEEAGIGRPATYNPIIQNIIARYYIEKDGKVLKPTELGFVICDLLEKYFINIMNIEFTAGLEEKLDEIAYEGREWITVIDEFYKPFEKDIETAMEGEDNITIATEISDTACEKCGQMMIVRIGRFGKFLSCPGFPECRNAKPFDKPICKCPKCADTHKGDIYKRKSKKGKIFFGCSSYPNCDFVAWDQPTGKLCERCGSAIVINPKDKKEKCNNRECS